MIPRQQVHLPEYLKGTDQGHDGHKQKGGGQIADLYVEKSLQGRGALQSGHLQDIPGNTGQGRHKHNHIVPQVLPQEQDNHHDQRIIRLYPVNLPASQSHKHLVDRSVVMKKHLPYQNNRSHRHHHGTQKKSPKLTPKRQLCVQHNGQQQREHHSQRHRRHRKGKGIDHRRLKGGVSHGILIIFKKHKIVGDGTVHQRIYHHHQKRKDEECHHAQETGQDKCP